MCSLKSLSCCWSYSTCGCCGLVWRLLGSMSLGLYGMSLVLGRTGDCCGFGWNGLRRDCNGGGGGCLCAGCLGAALFEGVFAFGGGFGALPFAGLCFGGGGGGFGVYIPAFGVCVFVGKMCRSSPTCLVFCRSLHCLFASTHVLQSEKFASL